MTFVSPPLDAFADAAKKKYAATRNLGELMWTQYPGHFNQALSKAIVTPATVGSACAGKIERSIGVSTAPGLTQKARMPCAAPSLCALRVKLSSAALLAP